MGVKVSPFGSSAVVEIADELVERYTEQGWVVAEKPAEPKKDAKPSAKK